MGVRRCRAPAPRPRPRTRRPPRSAAFSPKPSLCGSVLFWLAVPPHAVADPAAQPPFGGLWSAFDRRPKNVEPLLDQARGFCAEVVSSEVALTPLDRCLRGSPQAPVLRTEVGDEVAFDPGTLTDAHVVVIREVVDVALVGLVQLDNLELGQEQLGQRDGEPVVLEAIRDRDHVTHREFADEDVELALVGVVEEESLRSMQRVEHLIWDIT